jgi:hypothetical protein
MWKENSDLRALVQQQQVTIGKMEGEVQQLQAEATEVKVHLKEIRESRAWRFMSRLQKIRLFFIPRGSKAERVLLKKGK